MNDTPQTTTTVAKQSKPTTIRDRLESNEFKSAVAKALPRHLTPDRFIRVACTAIMRQPKLAQCDQTSFFNALLTLSQLGIEPDGRRAHLIPFNNSKRGVIEVQLIIDYKGLVELIMRSGVVSNLHADIVCENDIFGYDMGQIKMHRVNFKEPRGKPYAVYCICRFKDGSEKCDVMTVEEIEAVRKRSRAANDGPWVTDWNEMAKKTVFRRLSKWLPLSPEFRDAIEADEDTPIGITTTSVPFEIEPPKTKPRIGEPKSTATQPASAPPEQEQPAPNPQADSDDGDLGPQSAQPTADTPAAKVKEPEPENVTRMPDKNPPAQAQSSAQSDDLAALVIKRGVSFENFVKWLVGSGRCVDAANWKSFDDLPNDVAVKLMANERALGKLFQMYGAGN